TRRRWPKAARSGSPARRWWTRSRSCWASRSRVSRRDPRARAPRDVHDVHEAVSLEQADRGARAIAARADHRERARLRDARELTLEPVERNRERAGDVAAFVLAGPPHVENRQARASL